MNSANFMYLILGVAIGISSTIAISVLMAASEIAYRESQYHDE